ncbi:MAG: HAMP domain-containing histidine kinase [Firmicutes bacterium]|nr:HAMP domain-containing histidine kinase [Bacillota bacterium]
MKKMISVKAKMTLWLTILMIVLSGVLVGFMMLLSQAVARRTAMSQLKSAVQNNVQYVSVNDAKPEINGTFAYYQNGVSLLVYSRSETLLAGQVPVTYTAQGSFENGVLRTVPVLDGEYLVLDVWIPAGWENGVWLRGVMENPDSHQLNSSLLTMAVLTLPIFVVLTVFGGYRIVKKAFRPLDHINATVAEINGAKDLSGRIGLPQGRDEFSRLAENFDGMLERLERSFEAEKQFTSDASHELRTPVSIIKGACEFAEKYDETPEERKETIEMIHRQADRMTKLIQQLLSMTRMEQGTEKFKLLSENLLEILLTLCEEEKWDKARFHLNIPEHIMVRVDQELFKRLIRNLVENGFKYGKPKGQVWIGAYEENGELLISVKDDGIGIAKEEQEKVWNRFYQSDASRSDEEGAGLGLAIVQQIAKLHGGYMTLQSELGQGSTFTLHLTKMAQNMKEYAKSI